MRRQKSEKQWDTKNPVQQVLTVPVNLAGDLLASPPTDFRVFSLLYNIYIITYIQNESNCKNVIGHSSITKVEYF